MADTPEMLTARMNNLTQRVTALEKPIPPQPPATKIESADLTTIPPADSIVDAALRTLQAVGGKVVVDGVTIAATSGVVLLKKVDRPANPAIAKGVYQKNSAGSWYGPITPTSGGAQVPGDPSLATPIPPIPPQAAAQGFNVRTYGPNVTVGSNWLVREGTNVNNPDGSMTTFGTGGYNACIQSALMLGGGNWRGKAFGGGAYFEATLKWSGTTTQAGGGWPGWWSNDIEMQAQEFGPQAHWPGQPSGTLIWFEPDFMEAFGEGGYGTAFHNWYSNNGGADRPDVQAMPPSFRFPAGFDHNAYHKYGWLWVTATPTTQGFAASYLDDVEWQRVRWNYPTGTVPYPPSLRDGVISTGGLMDTRHLYLILGSGPNNPMTVSSVEVWQTSEVNNLTR